MRPAAIQRFERLLLLALAIDLINNLTAWNQTTANLSARGLPSSPVLVFAISTLPAVIGLILLYFIARRKSNSARWITTILVVLGTVGFAATAFKGTGSVLRPLFIVAAVAELLKLAAVVCLFTASATAWFARKQRPI